MARNIMSTPTPVAAPLPQVPHSPRESESPPPPGLQGDLEIELLNLAQKLYDLGITVVSDLTKEKDKPGNGKNVGTRVNHVIESLGMLEKMSESITTTVPLQVLVDIDNSRNPMLLTKERLERAATENQFMNGKIHAIESYRRMLDEALVQNFPDLGEHLMESAMLTATGAHGVQAEEDGMPGPSGHVNGFPNGA
uniref:Mediator of RNA polymerase II transcription subunit 10 n=1 Tax=Ganoderma boninense TaxID=34458 RepID=A0A5K1K444_9APHY|nr:Alcohol oxidase [Ganoderma boninense]